MFKYW